MLVTNERGFRVGTTQIRAAHLPDGATAFWGNTADMAPIAKRWTSGEAPWRVSLGLEGTESAAADVELSIDPWKYSLDMEKRSVFRKALRSVVAVQVRACAWDMACAGLLAGCLSLCTIAALQLQHALAAAQPRQAARTVSAACQSNITSRMITSKP